jgi:hypothetical protein
VDLSREAIVRTIDHDQGSLEAGAETGTVSPNNPCPFLRALVADGYLDGHIEPLSAIARAVDATNSGASPDERISKIPVYLIGMIANGLKPRQLLRNLRKGVVLDGLRGGPLDKRGAGSRILDERGQIDERELARLDEFATDKTDPSGQIERGLGFDQLRAMMDANFARAAGHRRRLDRRLMNGEWPVLLRVIGKNSGPARYLSLAELRTLFVERRLPDRVRQFMPMKR